MEVIKISLVPELARPKNFDRVQERESIIEKGVNPSKDRQRLLSFKEEGAGKYLQLIQPADGSLENDLMQMQEENMDPFNNDIELGRADGAEDQGNDTDE